MASERPPRLPERRPTNASHRDSATYIALLALVSVGMGLLGLVAIVLPQVQGLILVIGGAASLFAIHYLLWGHWLSRIVDRDPPDDFPLPPET